MKGLAMPTEPFEVFVPDYTSSIEEYRRAQRAPKSELPQLTGDQKAVARRFKISEEKYARGVLAGIYGRERQRARGKELGETVQAIVDDFGTRAQVVRVAYQSDRLRWLISMKTSDGIVDVAVPRELGDDVLDTALRESAEELRGRVGRALGLAGTLAKP